MKNLFKLIKKNIVTRKIEIIIFSFFIFHIVNNYIIVIIQNFASLPISVLESKSYAASLKYLYLIKDSILSGHLPNLYLPTGFTNDPPFYYFSTLPFYFLFGHSKGVAIMSNSLYFLILLFSVYGIGEKMLNKKAGLLASFFVSMIPAVFGYSRVYHIPFALMSLTALSINLLLRTGNFVNRKYSILLGISMGLLGITRFTGAVYLIGPYLYFCFRTIANYPAQPHRELKIKGVNFLTSILICFFILSLWYIPKGNLLWRYYSSSDNINFLELWKLNANFDYLNLLIDSQLLPVFGTIFFVSLFFFLFSKKNDKWIIFSWIVLPYLFFTLFWHVRESYQTIPCLPAMALVISFTITKFCFERKTRLTLIPVLILISFAIFQFFSLSYNAENIFLKDYHLCRLAAGKIMKGKYQKILSQIIPEITTRKKNARILFLSITPSGLLVESLLHEVNINNRIGLIVENPLGWISSGSIKLSNLGIDGKYFLDQDYIIYTSNNRYLYENFYSQSPVSIKNDLMKLMNQFEEYKTYFLLVKEITSDDSDKFLIYRRPDIVPEGQK